MIVIDASAIVRILAHEPGAEEALIRIDADAERVAPDVIRIEVANALANKVAHQGLPRNVAKLLWSTLPSYVGTIVPSSPLVEDAFEMALRLRHAVYDCLYAVLAERQDAVLVTADKHFASRVAEHGLATKVELLR